MATARYDHTAALLPNRKVLITGGSNGRAISSAEIYDPSTNIWTPAGSMGTARYNHTATLLPDGAVLIAGQFTRDLFQYSSLLDRFSGFGKPLFLTALCAPV